MTETPRHREIECDVLVVGGGPGGSTVSTLLARRGHRVVVLEKETHPRFHIGESLLPMNMPILDRLGVLEKVKEIGVVKWGADFSLGDDASYVTYNFADAFSDSPPHAYEVTRSEFDELLFRNATANGVDTREGMRVTRIDFEADTTSRIEAVDTAGDLHVFRARYLVDASGRDTFLSKKLGLKRKNPRHGSAAIFSHFTGVERRPGDEQGNISIYWFEHGWMWLIPLKDDLTSIGAVCHPDYLRDRSVSNEEFLLATLKRCPQLADRLAGATRVADVRATGNFSYTSTKMAGPGFVMVGDAFAFIDPVFSSGVYLAMNSGEHAAEVVDGILLDRSREAKLQREYAGFVRKGIGTFSWFIYRFNTPGLRWIFTHPRNVLRLQEVVTSMLAGDVFRNRDIHRRFKALQVIYAVRSFAELRSYLGSVFQRRKNAREGFDGGTLSVDRDMAPGVVSTDAVRAPSATAAKKKSTEELDSP